MLSDQQVRDAIGATAYDPDGDKLGKVGQVYFDDQIGRPEWATVNTGLFGTSESFVPLRDATLDDGRLTVMHSKQQVKGAPNVGDDGHLSEAEERTLYDHYGVGYDTAPSGGAPPTTTGDQSYADGRDTSGQTTDGNDTSGTTTDDAMTRSEERLDVGTTTETAGRARLRKYVETEHVTQTVPVRKEKAVVEREPITDANASDAASGPDISEEEHEITLSEERVEVSKTTEPVERVRLGSEEFVDEEAVEADIRKERIETEGDVRDGRDGRV